MSTTVGARTGRPDPSLVPVTERLLADARRRAHEILADADEQARRTRETAGALATQILEQARKEGAAAPARAVTAMVVDARRRSRHLVLDARRRAYEDVRHAVGAELALRHDSPEARALRDRLSAACRARLGPQADVVADQGCGVVASLGARRIDLGTPVLVDGAMQSLGEQLAGLWAP